MRARDRTFLVAPTRARLRANGDWNINDWKDAARGLANDVEALAALIRQRCPACALGLKVTEEGDHPGGGPCELTPQERAAVPPGAHF